jgi:hypothetical protein
MMLSSSEVLPIAETTGMFTAYEAVLHFFRPEPLAPDLDRTINISIRKGKRAVHAIYSCANSAFTCVVLDNRSVNNDPKVDTTIRLA